MLDITIDQRVVIIRILCLRLIERKPLKYSHVAFAKSRCLNDRNIEYFSKRSGGLYRARKVAGINCSDAFFGQHFGRKLCLMFPEG
jgi:hypothetical protein